ncbi:MAG: hypothetical protein ABUS48_00880 [Pseudomonadota bacterium]
MKMLVRAAPLAPSTFDEKTNTVEVVLSTGAAVRRAGFIEVLPVENADLRGIEGSPVLDAHSQASTRSVLGVIEKAWKAAGEIRARLKLSSRDDAAGTVKDVRDGILRNLSIGYRVSKWAESTNSKGERVRTALAFSIGEASFVPLGADSGAVVRSNPMKKKVAAGVNPASVDDVDDTLENENVETVTEHAQRNSAIRLLCRNNGMTQAFTDKLIDGEGDLIAARAAVNDELQRRTPVMRAQVGVDHTDPRELMTRQIGGAFAHATGAKPADNEREFVGLSLLQNFREMLERRNINTRRMSDGDLIARAFGTGDAAEFLTGVGNRSTQAAYAAARHPVMDLATTKTVTDYRPVSFLRDTAFDGELEPLSEHGEFTRTSFDESKLTASVDDYARGFDVTDKAIRNDDLSVLTGIPAKFGAMAARKDASLVLGLLSGTGPLVEDGHNLFDAANHAGNYEAGGTPLGLESLSAGRLAMRSITGEKGEALNLAPSFLVVSKELETVAEQLLATITPIATPDVQPIKLTLIVDGGLEPFSWYLFAAPAAAPVLAILRLSGAEAPRVEQSSAWNSYAQQFRVKHTVGATALGWRGAAKWASGENSNSEIFE